MEKHIIDLNADPFLPQDNACNGRWFQVVEHRKGGVLEWDQTHGKLIDLLKEVHFNANLAVYLLQHPEIIPIEWKERKVVMFPGTVLNKNGNLCVRCIAWAGKSPVYSTVQEGWQGFWLMSTGMDDGYPPRLAIPAFH